MSKIISVEARVWKLWLSPQCLRVTKDFEVSDFVQFAIQTDSFEGEGDL